MLPQETSVRQLKKLRAETKGTDIGDLTKDDRLNHNIPNLQYIGNPVDTGIESWQDFCQKDSKIQTIAFKSKLANKPIVKENKTENMKDVKKFENFNDDYNEEDILRKYEKPDYEDRDIEPGYYEEYEDEEYDRDDIINLIYTSSDYEIEDLEELSDEELKDIYIDLELDQDYDNDDLDDNLDELEENVKTFKNFDKKIKESRLDKNLYQDEEGLRHSRYLIRKKMEEDEEQEFFERPLEGEEIDEIDELESDDELFNDEETINDEEGASLGWFSSYGDIITNNDEEEFESVKKFEDFDNEDREINFGKIDFDNFDNDPHRNDLIKIISMNSDFEIEELKNKSDDELEKLYYDLYHNDLDESIKTFEAFSVPAAKKEEKQPEYTILGQEKEPKSNTNFGIDAVKAQEIKKISDFNLIDPPTPKERTIGGSAGVFIDNGTVKGFVNRIEGKDAYIESVDDPMVIKKFNLKDVVKTKKSE